MHVDAGRAANGRRRAGPGADPGAPGAPGGSKPHALLLPGRGYGAHQPLLHYARRCLAEAGHEVRVLQWPRGELGADVVTRLVEEAAAALPRGSAGLVLIAKSMGTHAIPWAAEHGVPGIWLTPLLQVPAVRAALPALPPGSLLAGGTADPTWDGDVAAASGLPVLQLEGADHNLEIPGDVHRSLAALGRIVTAISETLVPSFREDLTPIRGLPLR